MVEVPEESIDMTNDVESGAMSGQSICSLFFREQQLGVYGI
jgi:hypothetical protein